MSFPPGVDNVIGGDREEPTRQMILAGKAWIDAHPEARPEFQLSDYVMHALNDDAVELMLAILAVAPVVKIQLDGKSHDSHDEAMVQTAINHCSFIRRNGWKLGVRDPELAWRQYIRTMTPVKHSCTCSGVAPYDINCMAHGYLVPK